MSDGTDFGRGHGPYGSRRQKVVDPMRERTQIWLEKHLGDLARFVQLGSNEFPDALAQLLSRIERETREADIAASCAACAKGVRMLLHTPGRHRNGYPCGAFGIRALAKG